MHPAGRSIGLVKEAVPCLPLKQTGRPLNLNIFLTVQDSMNKDFPMKKLPRPFF